MSTFWKCGNCGLTNTYQKSTCQACFEQKPRKQNLMMITTMNKQIHTLKTILSDELPNDWEYITNSTIVQDRQTKSIRTFYNLFRVFDAGHPMADNLFP